MDPAGQGPVAPFPRVRPVAERAILVEFGETIETWIHDQVMSLDAAIAARPFAGFAEAVPAYASLLVCFDPLVTDHRTAEIEVRARIGTGPGVAPGGTLHAIDVCYEGDLAPDLDAVAAARGLTTDAVIAHHLAGAYRVFMYGFAPGYAYLAGVPEPLRLPRKAAAVRGVPAGSVLIAGAQCIVSTLTMPTGWWVIGRSPTRILNRGPEGQPFLLDVGGRVRFRRISRDAYDASRAP